MPLDDQRLVVEPKYPNAEKLMAIGKAAMAAAERKTPEEHGCKIRNSFFSTVRRVQIVIWQEADGRIAWGPGSLPQHATELLNTIGASWAWGIEQEGTAVRTLADLLRHNQFKQYMLTGMFLESSKRSGLTYMFRRLRPTIALSMRGDVVRIIGALCLHPIAYYAHSWAGAMCPTDDVIAHLMLMRGDEHMFWRRANQHRPGDPLAGI